MSTPPTADLWLSLPLVHDHAEQARLDAAVLAAQDGPGQLFLLFEAGNEPPGLRPEVIRIRTTLPPDAADWRYARRLYGADPDLPAPEMPAQDAEAPPPGFILWDHDWQTPAITEQHAYRCLSRPPRGLPPGVRYLAFPWATLIDNLLHNWQNPARADHLQRALKVMAPRLKSGLRVVTTCQHIHMLEFQQLFADLGVTDIFWSHATRGQTALPDHPQIRIHPFPLYPVQAAGAAPNPDAPRPLLYSFVGARANQWYLSEARNLILSELADDSDGLVIGRADWHYNRAVYDHQVRGTADPGQPLIDNDASAQFRAVLQDSVFALCPSGTGPNSIRLWEAISLGAIPVIMAETLALPGDPDLWQKAAVFCGEDGDSIRALPARLRDLAQDPAATRAMRRALAQIAERYGATGFASDIADLLRAPLALPEQDQSLPDPELTLLMGELLTDPEAARRRIASRALWRHYDLAPARQQADLLIALRAAGLSLSPFLPGPGSAAQPPQPA